MLCSKSQKQILQAKEENYWEKKIIKWKIGIEWQKIALAVVFNQIMLVLKH